MKLGPPDCHTRWAQDQGAINAETLLLDNTERQGGPIMKRAHPARPGRAPLCGEPHASASGYAGRNRILVARVESV